MMPSDERITYFFTLVIIVFILFPRVLSDTRNPTPKRRFLLDYDIGEPQFPENSDDLLIPIDLHTSEIYYANETFTGSSIYLSSNGYVEFSSSPPLYPLRCSTRNFSDTIYRNRYVIAPLCDDFFTLSRSSSNKIFYRSSTQGHRNEEHYVLFDPAELTVLSNYINSNYLFPLLRNSESDVANTNISVDYFLVFTFYRVSRLHNSPIKYSHQTIVATDSSLKLTFAIFQYDTYPYPNIYQEKNKHQPISPYLISNTPNIMGLLSPQKKLKLADHITYIPYMYPLDIFLSSNIGNHGSYIFRVDSIHSISFNEPRFNDDETYGCGTGYDILACGRLRKANSTKKNNRGKCVSFKNQVVQKHQNSSINITKIQLLSRCVCNFGYFGSLCQEELKCNNISFGSDEVCNKLGTCQVLDRNATLKREDGICDCSVLQRRDSRYYFSVGEYEGSGTGNVYFDGHDCKVNGTLHSTKKKQNMGIEVIQGFTDFSKFWSFKHPNFSLVEYTGSGQNVNISSSCLGEFSTEHQQHKFGEFIQSLQLQTIHQFNSTLSNTTNTSNTTNVERMTFLTTKKMKNGQYAISFFTNICNPRNARSLEYNLVTIISQNPKNSGSSDKKNDEEFEEVLVLDTPHHHISQNSYNFEVSYPPKNSHNLHQDVDGFFISFGFQSNSSLSLHVPSDELKLVHFSIDSLSIVMVKPWDLYECSGRGRLDALGREQETCSCEDGYFDADKKCLEFSCFGVPGNDFNKKEVCSGHGLCVNDDICNCTTKTTSVHAVWNDGDWVGSNCERMDGCGGIDKDSTLVCSSHGRCVLGGIDRSNTVHLYESNFCCCRYRYGGKYCDVFHSNGVLDEFEMRRMARCFNKQSVTDDIVEDIDTKNTRNKMIEIVRGGYIIRNELLNREVEMYCKNPKLVNYESDDISERRKREGKVSGNQLIEIDEMILFSGYFQREVVSNWVFSRGEYLIRMVILRCDIGDERTEHIKNREVILLDLIVQEERVVNDGLPWENFMVAESLLSTIDLNSDVVEFSLVFKTNTTFRLLLNQRMNSRQRSVNSFGEDSTWGISSIELSRHKIEGDPYSDWWILILFSLFTGALCIVVCVICAVLSYAFYNKFRNVLRKHVETNRETLLEQQLHEEEYFPWEIANANQSNVDNTDDSGTDSVSASDIDSRASSILYYSDFDEDEKFSDNTSLLSGIGEFGKNSLKKVGSMGYGVGKMGVGVGVGVGRVGIGVGKKGLSSVGDFGKNWKFWKRRQKQIDNEKKKERKRRNSEIIDRMKKIVIPEKKKKRKKKRGQKRKKVQEIEEIEGEEIELENIHPTQEQEHQIEEEEEEYVKKKL